MYKHIIIAILLCALALSCLASRKKLRARKHKATKQTYIGDTLNEGKVLKGNEGLKSPSGEYIAHLGNDGNFVVYQWNTSPSNAKWSTGTWGKYNTGQAPFYVGIWPSKGGLVLYDSWTTPLWFTGISGNPQGLKLTIKNDGNLALTDKNGFEYWSRYNGKTYTSSVKILGNSITKGKTIKQDEALRSNNKKYYAVMQNDRNFVIYEGNVFRSKNSRWSTGTSDYGSDPYKITLQNDGNLVLTDRSGNACWSKGSGYANKLVLEDNGQLVMYDGRNGKVWSSNW